MPIPRLIHPTTVTIEQLDRAATLYDDDAREPIGQAARKAPVVLQAQVLWGGGGAQEDSPDPQEAGIREKSSGYLLFRVVDLAAAAVTLQREDRITSIGILAGLNLYLTEFHPMAYYPDQGGHTLLKCFFEDRAPVKQVGDL